MSPGHEYYRQQPDADELEVELEETADGEPYEDGYAARPRSLSTYEEMLDSDWVDQPLRELLGERIHALGGR
jgi:hypothetical protein